MAIMNKGDIIHPVFHDQPATRAGAPAITPKRTASAPRADKPKPNWPTVCGAMSEQQGGTSAQSTPQKFVHLVGYRDPNTKPIRR